MAKDDDGLIRITEQILRSNPEPMDVSVPAASSSTGQVQPATSSNNPAPSSSALPTQAPSRGTKRDAPTAELPADAQSTEDAMRMLSNFELQYDQRQTNQDADVVSLVKNLRQKLSDDGLLGALDSMQHVDEPEPLQLHPEYYTEVYDTSTGELLPADLVAKG